MEYVNADVNAPLVERTLSQFRQQVIRTINKYVTS
jgi:hypothetical protein